MRIRIPVRDTGYSDTSFFQKQRYRDTPIYIKIAYPGVSVEYGYPIRYPIPVHEFCEVSAYHSPICMKIAFYFHVSKMTVG